MNKIEILTKQNCIKCQNLKNFLNFGVDKEILKKVFFINKENDYHIFETKIKEFKITSLPAVIINSHILRNVTPSSFLNFLQEKS